MASGSQRLFYGAWREHYGAPGILFTSYLDDINQTFEAAMNWEEAKVDQIANDQYGLNMIPGGFKGLSLLHKARIIQSTSISLDEREHAMPNPFVAELWKDDNFYTKVIEAKEKTLNVEQVRQIRLLDKQGMKIPDIVREVKALNEQQVKGVISGRNYKRVR
jgi:hypothetical protein